MLMMLLVLGVAFAISGCRTNIDIGVFEMDKRQPIPGREVSAHIDNFLRILSLDFEYFRLVRVTFKGETSSYR